MIATNDEILCWQREMAWERMNEDIKMTRDITP